MACNMGEVATVEAWLDSGNHPDDATTFGGTLLVAAAERGGPDMMTSFLSGAPRAPLTRIGPSIACGRGICRPRTEGGILMRAPPA